MIAWPSHIRAEKKAQISGLRPREGATPKLNNCTFVPQNTLQDQRHTLHRDAEPGDQQPKPPKQMLS